MLPLRGMKTVYLIRSIARPEERYIGITTDVHARLQAHNTRRSRHTAKHAPWELVTYVCFQDDTRADAFERYLKTGSGFAFANRRLW